MDILCARHGNTFDPGDKVVWVGRETDLPLVAKGEAQAAALADALAVLKFLPTVVFAGTLRRTGRFASIVAEKLGLPAPRLDARLDEVDYGAWAGRTNDEIASLGATASAEMEQWNERDLWPAEGGWITKEADLRANIASFAIEHLQAGSGQANPGSRPLVVSSNGVLRFLPRAIMPSAAQERPSFKMKTGHTGMIRREGGRNELLCWDVPPERLAEFLKK